MESNRIDLGRIRREHTPSQGKTYSLLGPNTTHDGQRRTGSLPEVSTSEYTTRIERVKISGREISFVAKLVHNDFSRVSILNPVDFHQGYPIDWQDASPETRLQKLLAGYDTYQQMIGRKEGLLDLRISVPAIHEAEALRKVPLQVMIDTPGGPFIGDFGYNQYGLLVCEEFLPDPPPEIASVKIPQERYNEILDKNPDDVLTDDELDKLRAIIHAPTRFSLLFPDDRTVLENTSLQFVVGKRDAGKGQGLQEAA